MIQIVQIINIETSYLTHVLVYVLPLHLLMQIAFLEIVYLFALQLRTIMLIYKPECVFLDVLMGCLPKI